MGELLAATGPVYDEQLGLCVWAKDSAGMGSLYRSQHELILVFKKEGAPHRNNIMLGKYGRNRTNVWDFPGQNTFHAGRTADLAAHPTVKPTNLVAEAIRDVSRRGEIVLDPFGGSGTTVLAAEKTGRRARLFELDPVYVDVAVRRWQALTGGQARLEGTGRTFAQVAAGRRDGAEVLPFPDPVAAKAARRRTKRAAASAPETHSNDGGRDEEAA